MAENNNEKRKSVRYMLFKRYKYLELEKTEITDYCKDNSRFLR